MVSGLSTSPYDQLLIVSGEARLIRKAIKLLVSTELPPQLIDPQTLTTTSAWGIPLKRFLG
jgi:hypothetical protein